MMTLQDLITHIEKAIPLYKEMAEDDAMCGDYESSESWDNEVKKLELLIKSLKEQFVVNKIVPTVSIKKWLDEEGHEEVKKTILYALERLKERDLYNIKKLNENVEFYDKFLKNGE